MGEIAFSIVLLIIGIIAGGLVTFKLQKHKEPTYFFQSHSIFEDSASKHDGLSVRYNNTTINGLTSVYLAFWNSGKETITSNHIVEDIEITLINRAGVKSDNGRTGLLGSVFGLFFDIYEEIKDTRHTGTKQNILNAQVVIQTRDSNKFQATLSEDGLSVKLDFKYIEHNDGAV
ncbi:MAG: hypothetical protein FWD21_02370, partial [Peptococcaceae bacterium]|nr:hypothetical protein [Peptococcaceae bacterium]